MKTNVTMIDNNAIESDLALTQNTASARWFSRILKIAAVILGFLAVSLLGFTGFLMVPGLSEGLMADYIADGGAEYGSRAWLALSSLGAAIVIAAYFIVVRILGKIVKTLLDGDPFVPDNITRLRSIWIIIAGAEVFRLILRTVTSAMDNGGDVDVLMRPGTWFLVFVIAALAEVFRHGAELRRDAELTV